MLDHPHMIDRLPENFAESCGDVIRNRTAMAWHEMAGELSLTDTERRKDPAEQIIGCELAGNLRQALLSLS